MRIRRFKMGRIKGRTKKEQGPRGYKIAINVAFKLIL